MDVDSLKAMGKMIKLMLPYEYDYKPESTPSKTLNDIFQVMKEQNSKLDEMEPFLGSVMKKIDQSGDTSKMDKMFIKIGCIIHKYYSKNSQTENDTDFIYHPFDRGQYK